MVPRNRVSAFWSHGARLFNIASGTGDLPCTCDIVGAGYGPLACRLLVTMNDTPKTPASEPAEPPRRRNRLLFALPVAAFLILAVALAIGLYRDPSLVPSPLIGKPAPETALPAVPGYGPTFTRDDFMGQVTLVNVFASWCVSCRDEHPLLVRMSQQQDLPIFGLAYKDQPGDAAGWLDNFGNPYTATALDLNGRAAIEWGVYGVPETFLVGPDGTIVYKKIGPIGVEDITNDILPRVAALRAEIDAAAQEPATTRMGDEDDTDAVEQPAPEAAVPGAATLANLAWLDDPRGLPDATFYLAGGKEAQFADYAGKAIVLNYWATWCPPCLEEMPSLDRLAAQHADDDLVVMTMSLDRGDEAQIAAFYDQIGADSLSIYHDPDMATSRALRVFGLPTTLLIDHRGKVVAQLVGTAEWDSEAALAAILPLAQEARAARLGTDQQAQLDQ